MLALAVEGVQQELSFSLLSLAAQGGWLHDCFALSFNHCHLHFCERLFAISYAWQMTKIYKSITDYILEGKEKVRMALCKKTIRLFPMMRKVLIEWQAPGGYSDCS